MEFENAVFISAGNETKRSYVSGEKKKSGAALARLAIKIFEGDLDKLSEDEWRELKVNQSFYKKANPYDNAVIESFFSNMKREEINSNNFKSFDELSD